MNIIYSNKKISGLDGIYADPDLFDGSTENCETVYTDSEEIKNAYQAKGIEVYPITKEVRKKQPKLTD